MSFDPDQIKELIAPLDRANVKTRNQSGRQLSYVEGWHVIEEANRIFGFDGWTRETIDIRCVVEKPREIGQREDPGFGVTYTAKVRVNVGGVVREGCGADRGYRARAGARGAGKTLPRATSPVRLHSRTASRP